MTEQTITPPPHLLKQFSEQARVDSNKRGGSGYLKTFARFCIEWAMGQLDAKPTPNPLPIRSYDITPPPELVQQWCDASKTGEMHFYVDNLATRAAQWGADQELAACVDWFFDDQEDVETAALLRAARRPKPPSLKEQALVALHAIAVGANDMREQTQDFDTIRRALEALPE